MKAVILAGGRGTRLYPVAAEEPKPMTRLMGLPLLEHIVELLRQNGFSRLCMTLGYLPEIIMDYFGNGDKFGVSIEYRIETEPLGTAGGVRACADFAGEESLLVISGDAATDIDLARLFREHESGGGLITIALCRSAEPLEYGTVLLSPQGLVRGFIEKPDWPRVVTDLVSTGIYVVSPEALALIPEGEADFARDVFPLLRQRGLPLRGVQTPGYWCDVGSPQSYLACCMDALDGKLRLTKTAAEGRSEMGSSFLCNGAKVDNSAILEHSIIQMGGIVGADSRVTDSLVEGKIGKNCIVSGAVICRGAVVPDGQTVPAGSVLSPLPERKKALPVAVRKSAAGGVGLAKELACAGRASLMGSLSELLWETGADFSDGIRLTEGRCRVHISPLSDESAIAVRATGGTQRERTAACGKYFELAKTLEREKYSF